MTKAPQLHLDSTMEDSLLSMQEEVSQELNTKAFQNLSNQKFQHQNGAYLWERPMGDTSERSSQRKERLWTPWQHKDNRTQLAIERLIRSMKNTDCIFHYIFGLAD